MNVTIKWHLRLTVVFLGAVGAASISIQAASKSDPKYRITDIGTLAGAKCGVQGNAINSKGQIAG